MLTKKALVELTKLAALELAPRIRVNAVAPGAILPPPKHPELAVRDLAGKVPLARVPDPAEIADAVRFLLEADSVTGQIIFVDGGQNLLGNGV
jgi:NAD(P)-dependent dehydrogenase (short-subunit alcohol dehydrogenase family)